MHRKKKYVLGAGGAILRFFIMIPGVLMLLFGALGTLGSGGAVAASGEMKREMLAELSITYQEKGLQSEIVEATLASGRYEGDRSVLGGNDIRLLNDLENAYISVQAGEMVADGAAVLAGGFSIAMLIFGLICIAFGFLIGIRKWKLVCDNCGTAINAA